MLKFAAHVPIHRSLFTIGLENKKENPVWKELDLYPANKHLHNYNLPPPIVTDKFQESIGLHIFLYYYFSGNKNNFLLFSSKGENI